MARARSPVLGLGGTAVSIAGRQLPVLYAGPDQVNAMIPYDPPINTTHRLVVQTRHGDFDPAPGQRAELAVRRCLPKTSLVKALTL
jgi:uncharacterized protein (TIGR03437 family)